MPATITARAPNAPEHPFRTTIDRWVGPRQLEDFMQRARRATSERPLTPAEVGAWLRSEDAETRVVGLAAMRERPEVRELRALSGVFDDASSAFEQNHSMRVMIEMAPTLTPEEREELRRLVLRHRAETFGPSSHRWTVSERLLAALTEGTGDQPG